MSVGGSGRISGASYISCSCSISSIIRSASIRHNIQQKHARVNRRRWVARPSEFPTVGCPVPSTSLRAGSSRTLRRARAEKACSRESPIPRLLVSVIQIRLDQTHCYGCPHFLTLRGRVGNQSPPLTVQINRAACQKPGSKTWGIIGKCLYFALGFSLAVWLECWPAQGRPYLFRSRPWRLQL